MPLHVQGRLICQNEAQARIARENLPEHIRLTREEPGCVSFEVTPTDDPFVWALNETFTSAETFRAHQARTKASHWGRVSEGILRDFEVTEVP